MKKYIFFTLIAFCFTIAPTLSWAAGPSFTDEEIRVVHWLQQKFPHLQSQDRVWWRRVLDTQQKRIRYIMNHPNEDSSKNHDYFHRIKTQANSAEPAVNDFDTTKNRKNQTRRTTDAAHQGKKTIKPSAATAVKLPSADRQGAKKLQKRY